MSGDTIDLQGYFPFFLGTVSNRWTATSSREYLQEFGVGIGEWRVLASIKSFGEASSQQIVGLISMDASAVSRSVGKLEQEGLVIPVEGKFPGRTKPFRLTSKGERLYATMRERALARENALLADLTAAEREALLRLMQKIMARLGDI